MAAVIASASRLYAAIAAVHSSLSSTSKRSSYRAVRSRCPQEVITGKVEEGLGEEIEDGVGRQGAEVADDTGRGEPVLSGTRPGCRRPRRCPEHEPARQ